MKSTDTAFPDARNTAITADQLFIEELSAADADGALVTHDVDDACSLGLWHTGPCEPRISS